jgi:4a-hydroxytetrahydrobiopterin dehydratase
MTDQITPQQFQESEGVSDWRVMPDQSAVACFRTGDFDSGLALVNDIGRMAGEMNHHPDLELKYAEVFVTLTSHDVQGLSRRDAEMARRISALASERDIPADPNAVQR